MMRLHAWLPLAVLGTALAQGPRPPQFTEIKAYLNLSDTQIQQIQQAQQQAMTGAQALLPQIQTRQEALRDLLAKGTTDAAAVGRLVLEIEALHKQLRQMKEAGHQAAVAILSADQKAKLKTLEDAAKLRPVIEQANALALLTPPEPGAGPGMGGFGSGLRGPGPGAEMRFRRPMAR